MFLGITASLDEREKINPKLYDEAEITKYVKQLIEFKKPVIYDDEKLPLFEEFQKQEATTYSIKYCIPKITGFNFFLLEEMRMMEMLKLSRRLSSKTSLSLEPERLTQQNMMKF